MMRMVMMMSITRQIKMPLMMLAMIMMLLRWW
jgi:hypothetical protein